MVGAVPPPTAWRKLASVLAALLIDSALLCCATVPVAAPEYADVGIREVQHPRTVARAVVGHHRPEQIRRVLVAERVAVERRLAGAVLGRMRGAHVVPELVAKGVIGADARVGGDAEGPRREAGGQGRHYVAHPAGSASGVADDEHHQIGAQRVATRVDPVEQAVTGPLEAVQIGTEIAALGVGDQLGADEAQARHDAAVGVGDIRFRNAECNSCLDAEVGPAGRGPGRRRIERHNVDGAAVVGGHRRVAGAGAGTSSAGIGSRSTPVAAVSTRRTTWSGPPSAGSIE